MVSVIMGKTRTEFIYWAEHGPDWTDDPQHALWFARREDACTMCHVYKITGDVVDLGPPPPTPWKVFYFIAPLIVLWFALFWLTGCASTDYNPRNTANMTPEQIERELNP